jgi:hypothetical protein
MAIILTKKKAKVQVQDELVSDFAELIDRVGALSGEAEEIEAAIKELQTKLKPYKEALAELQAKLEELELGDDETAVELGTLYRLEIGKRGTSREVTDMRKVHELMGDELFYELAKINLKDLDNYLTLPQRKQVVKENRTKRSFKLVPKG